MTELEHAVGVIYGKYSSKEIKISADLMHDLAKWLDLVAYEKEREEKEWRLARHD